MQEVNYIGDLEQDMKEKTIENTLSVMSIGTNGNPSKKIWNFRILQF